MKQQSKMNTPTPAEHMPVKYPFLWLAAAVLAVYLPTMQFGFTQLDDSIFIQEFRAYNEDLSNLLTSFTRGVFHETNDTYYRPFLMNIMLLNYQVSGEDIAGYHAVNILLHLLSTVLLYRLFIALDVRQLHAFLLSLLFAVHPVLTQAVTWIPGRNDTLLAVFVFPFLTGILRYAKEGGARTLLLSALCLLCALFTKETALLAPAAGFVLLVIPGRYRWNERRVVVQYVVWLTCFLVYYGVKSAATVQPVAMDISGTLGDFVSRLPLIVQYIGKIFLPFNLSVFPIQEDTVYYYGVIALAALIGVVAFSRKNDLRLMLAGVLLFLVFLLPALLVPYSLNEQAFEHRLYLPVTGILLLLSQTTLFRNGLKDRTLIVSVAAVAILFSVLNYRHQQHFTDPVTFWKQAAETSPHSAYALMMYGARADGRPQKYAYIRKAYALNPDEKYLNYYYGLMLMEQDSIDLAEQHLLKEQQRSDYYECDFHLARISFHKKDFPLAAERMERYLTRDPMNVAANTNLLLLYLDMGLKDDATGQARKMQERGVSIAPEIQQRLK